MTSQSVGSVTQYRGAPVRDDVIVKSQYNGGVAPRGDRQFFVLDEDAGRLMANC